MRSRNLFRWLGFAFVAAAVAYLFWGLPPGFRP
jgi:hypothetical protein